MVYKVKIHRGNIFNLEFLFFLFFLLNKNSQEAQIDAELYLLNIIMITNDRLMLKFSNMNGSVMLINHKT